MKFREARMTAGLDRKLPSIRCLPGHQSPEMLRQWGAAEINRMGRPVRLASARPCFQVPNQVMAWGVDGDCCCWAARLTVMATAALRLRNDEFIGI